MNTKLRIHSTRMFAVVVLTVIASSGSAWEEYAPAVSGALFMTGCFLVGIGVLGRMWCSVYIAGRKTKELITVGPYSMCRNPLYLFSFLATIGVALASETMTIPVLVTIGFVWSYPGVIKREEAKLSSAHAADYAVYVSRTPRFVPNFALLAEPKDYRVDTRRLREDLVRALWFVGLIGVIEMFEELREIGVLPEFLRLY